MSNETPRPLETMHESDNNSSNTNEGSALWCEICETSGHDILAPIGLDPGTAVAVTSTPATIATIATTA